MKRAYIVGYGFAVIALCAVLLGVSRADEPEPKIKCDREAQTCVVPIAVLRDLLAANDELAAYIRQLQRRCTPTRGSET
jgi:hypothetical protein